MRFTLFEKSLTGITLLEANWRRIRNLKLVEVPQGDEKVMKSDFSDVEKFLRKYFPPGDEGRVNLKSLEVNFWWTIPRKYLEVPFHLREGVGLTDEHPLSRWVDGIDGLKNAEWIAWFHPFIGYEDTRVGRPG